MSINLRRSSALRIASLSAFASLLVSCAGTPAKSAQPAQPEKPEQAVAPAPAPAAVSATALAPAEPAVPAEESASAPADLSVVRRRPLPYPLIVAALHEPEPPARRVGAPSAAAATGAPPATASTPSLPEPEPRGAPASAQSAAKAAPSAGPAAPKAVPKEAPKAAPPKVAAPKAAAKDAPKKPEPEPKAAEPPNAAPAVLPLAPPSGAEAFLARPERQAEIARSVSAEAGMRVEVPFDGTGWTYLGERTGREGVTYETRRFEGAGLVFVLLASKPGDYVLRFQRQDALRGISYDELVALSVTPKPAVVAAPATVASAAEAQGTAAPSGKAAATGGQVPAAQSAAPATPVAPAATGSAAPHSVAAQPQAAPVATPSITETPTSLTIQARKELDAGRAQGAIEALDRLLARYPTGTDEAFYVYALALEANGPLKDIKRAYAFYKKVCSYYPQSAFWDAAAERISYIERHYFEIR